MSGFFRGKRQSNKRSWFLTSVALLLTISAAARSSAQQPPKAATPGRGHRPVIVFETDFGTANDAVAICKGVILGIAPNARIMDLTHQVKPFSIADGARFLSGVTPYYPPGTVSDEVSRFAIVKPRFPILASASQCRGSGRCLPARISSA